MTETDPAPAPCPVHPANYHDRPQVFPAPSARIFRFESVIGLPRRCARLEDELMEADRELEMMEHLRVLERRKRGSYLAAALLSAGLGVVVGVLVNPHDVDGSSQRLIASTVAVVVLIGIGVDRILDRIARVRAERIVDWRKRLGY